MNMRHPRTQNPQHGRDAGNQARRKTALPCVLLASVALSLSLAACDNTVSYTAPDASGDSVDPVATFSAFLSDSSPDPTAGEVILLGVDGAEASETTVLLAGNELQTLSSGDNNLLVLLPGGVAGSQTLLLSNSASAGQASVGLNVGAEFQYGGLLQGSEYSSGDELLAGRATDAALYQESTENSLPQLKLLSGLDATSTGALLAGIETIGEGAAQAVASLQSASTERVDEAAFLLLRGEQMIDIDTLFAAEGAAPAGASNLCDESELLRRAARISGKVEILRGIASFYTDDVELQNLVVGQLILGWTSALTEFATDYDDFTAACGAPLFTVETSAGNEQPPLLPQGQQVSIDIRGQYDMSEFELPGVCRSLASAFSDTSSDFGDIFSTDDSLGIDWIARDMWNARIDDPAALGLSLSIKEIPNADLDAVAEEGGTLGVTITEDGIDIIDTQAVTLVISRGTETSEIPIVVGPTPL